MKRDETIAKFKQTYKSCPMQQLLRNICALEEKRHSEVDRAGRRLASSGRACKMKMEPSEGYQSAETQQFLSAMNAAAGMGVEPTNAAMETE